MVDGALYSFFAIILFYVGSIVVQFVFFLSPVHSHPPYPLLSLLGPSSPHFCHSQEGEGALHFSKTFHFPCSPRTPPDFLTVQESGESRRGVLNEYWEARFMAVSSLVAYVVYVIIVATDAQYYLWGRCILVLIVIFIPTFTFYLEIGKPAYKWSDLFLFPFSFVMMISFLG